MNSLPNSEDFLSLCPQMLCTVLGGHFGKAHLGQPRHKYTCIHRACSIEKLLDSTGNVLWPGPDFMPAFWFSKTEAIVGNTQVASRRSILRRAICNRLYWALYIVPHVASRNANLPQPVTQLGPAALPERAACAVRRTLQGLMLRYSLHTSSACMWCAGRCRG